MGRSKRAPPGEAPPPGMPGSQQQPRRRVGAGDELVPDETPEMLEAHLEHLDDLRNAIAGLGRTDAQLRRRTAELSRQAIALEREKLARRGAETTQRWQSAFTAKRLLLAGAIVCALNWRTLSNVVEIALPDGMPLFPQGSPLNTNAARKRGGGQRGHRGRPPPKSGPRAPGGSEGSKKRSSTARADGTSSKAGRRGASAAPEEDGRHGDAFEAAAERAAKAEASEQAAAAAEADMEHAWEREPAHQAEYAANLRRFEHLRNVDTTNGKTAAGTRKPRSAKPLRRPGAVREEAPRMYSPSPPQHRRTPPAAAEVNLNSNPDGPRVTPGRTIPTQRSPGKTIPDPRWQSHDAAAGPPEPRDTAYGRGVPPSSSFDGNDEDVGIPPRQPPRFENPRGERGTDSADEEAEAFRFFESQQKQQKTKPGGFDPDAFPELFGGEAPASFEEFMAQAGDSLPGMPTMPADSNGGDGGAPRRRGPPPRQAQPPKGKAPPNPFAGKKKSAKEFAKKQRGPR